MTDRYIEEIYTLADAAHKNGQKAFQVHCFPFRMTNKRMVKATGHKWESFWRNLKSVHDQFEITRIPPKITVKDKHYVIRG